MHASSPAIAPLIAVLEDDPFQRMWFERVLERAAFRVRTYADPGDFLARRGERPLPDVLLLDIILPEMDAFEVLAKLEEDEHWCLVPIVLMTASATKERVLAAQNLLLRPEGFLAKPVVTQATLMLLRSICDPQDPTMRLRRLHRRRRSLELSMRGAIKELESAAAVHARLLAARQTVGRKRRRIRELEAEITALAQAKAPPPGVSGPSVAHWDHGSCGDPNKRT